jgi:predicted PurR-regulated permease PerM
LKVSAIARALALAALVFFIAWAMYEARGALLIIYISGLMATGLGPVVHAIEHMVPAGTQRVPRWLAILVIYVGLVGTLTAVGILVIPPLVDQAEQLGTQAPALLDRAQSFLIARGLLDHRITVGEAVQRAPGPGAAVGTVATAVTRVFAAILAFITILILTFYLLIESDVLFAAFARLFPRADRPRVEEAATEISTKVSAWLSGQLILAGTIGVTAAMGLYLLGVPYFYVLAVVAAIGETIPMIGPMLSAIPAVIVGFTVSPKTGLFVLLFWIVQQQVENHLLVPKVMERQVGVSAVTVIVALLIGGSVLGIMGAVLAVPTAAILQVVIQEFLDERDRRQESSDLR